MSIKKQLIIQEIDTEELITLISVVVRRELKGGGVDPGSVNEELLTRKQAAAFLNVSLPTLHTLSLRGDVKAYRLRKNVLYKKSELIKSLKPFNLG